MPFPKDVRPAGEVASELRGEPITSFLEEDLLLKSVDFETSSSYGEITNLHCQREDDTEVNVSTFSEVVANQARKLAEYLPVIITPRKTKNYFTIY